MRERESETTKRTHPKIRAAPVEDASCALAACGPDFTRLSSCNLPTETGTVQLCVYGEPGGASWVVCISGAVRGRQSVHLRVHDACLTSEVLGSLKCDCALQLRMFQQHIATHGGVLIYTPQEGRGIGLANKVAAYSLQEQGLDTVDANTALGLPEEARDYTRVRAILTDLGVASVVLLTNNPFKLRTLRSLGIQVESAASILPDGLPEQCVGYLRTKAARMGHMLPSSRLHARDAEKAPRLRVPEECVECDDSLSRSGAAETTPLPWGERDEVALLLKTLSHEIERHTRREDTTTSRRRPFVTLTYAQTLDGSIAGPLGASGERLIISGVPSMTMTHALRAIHDAIIVGVGTALADNPQLTVRLTPGRNPLRVVLDGQLRVPVDSKMMRAGVERRTTAAVVTLQRTLCNSAAAMRAAHLRSCRVRVLAVKPDERGKVPLTSALSVLGERLRVRSAMVEGGTEVIASCALERAAHRVVLTLGPKLTHGTRPAFKVLSERAPSLNEAACPLYGVHSFCLGDDVVVSGRGPSFDRLAMQE
ncbi:hypothetical protein AB1Y20_017625 [Prymnesium parvum]